MFTLEKTFRFEASHQLPNHDGKCARLHGHSWVCVIHLEGYKLVDQGPKQGMLMDYGDISASMKDLIENYLDHWHLNETTGLSNPTSEELARWIYTRLEQVFRSHLSPDRTLLKAVTVRETCTSSATYQPS